MRWIVAAFALLAFPALGQQAGTVSFGAPTTGGAPSGYRLYRDNVLVGPVTSGQTVSGLFPASTGTWTFAVEGFNATGPGPRSSVTVSLGPPIPGAPVQIVISAPCVAAGTCVITIEP